MGLIGNYIKTYLIDIVRHPFCITGRANRKTFWFFTLNYLVLFFITELIARYIADFLDKYPTDSIFAIITGSVAFVIFLLFDAWLLFSLMCLMVRRIQDTNRSGWYFMLSFVPFVGEIIMLVFALIPGTKGENLYDKNETYNNKSRLALYIPITITVIILLNVIFE